MTYEINTFQLNNLCENPTILVDAKRGSGKSILIRELINYYNTVKHYKCGIIVSSTEQVNPFYSSFFPDLFIFQDVEIALEKVLERQKSIKRKNEQRMIKGYKPYDSRILVVLDDVLADANKWKNSLSIREVMCNGRHYGITLILAVQQTKGIPPIARNNFDYIFLFNNDNQTELKIIYDEYGGAFQNFLQFKTILAKLTENYGIMVIQRRDTKTHNFSDCIMYFKANINLRPAMFGSHKFIKYHYRRYNKNWAYEQHNHVLNDHLKQAPLNDIKIIKAD